MDYRIGQGYDIHVFAENRPLILGGVKIEYEKGLLGHSDADVLTHAIIDALLGALNLGDIGTHFPDNDNKYKDIDSLLLLKKVYNLVLEEGYTINNIDSSIILEKPKLKDYKILISEKLAQTLEINPKLISVKAKTNEKCDATGQGLAIEAHAVVLLKKDKEL